MFRFRRSVLLSLAIYVVLMFLEVKYCILEVIEGLANGSSLAGGQSPAIGRNIIIKFRSDFKESELIC